MKTNSEILNQTYLSANDIKQIIPAWGINAIRKFMDEILLQMKEEGYFIIQTKKKLVLTKLVKEKLGI